MASIKTPDQRVRVFISSTLQELAPERVAAKEAVLKLRLIPVLFESGARPHPPRDLYRSYLEQSHIFVGIYWNSYGWIAPDMDISGLEDEYRLSKDKTRLIYVKESHERQAQLSQLLHDIENSDAITYQRFSTVEEFRELLENDLAFLLSDHFDDHLEDMAVKVKSTSFKPLPFLRTALIGREHELQQLQDLLQQPDSGLITMVGPGGTGKTRLALELAHTMGKQFPDGVCFVPLTSISDPMQVTNTVAHELGMLDTGQQDIAETMIAFLRDKKMLLLIDNFEHVIAGTGIVSQLLSSCPDIKIVVTSRTPLQLREEKLFHVAPLEIGHDSTAANIHDLSPCAQLFIARASDINPHVALTTENVLAINTICRKLDGLPLAIELAAARSRLLSPMALLSRMDQSLDLLSQGPRDLPERHQTMRATIDWSYKLLDEPSRKLLRQLSVFSNGWTLDAASYIMAQSGIDGDSLELTEKLINVGLIQVMEQVDAHQAEPRFTMLQTVKEYAYGIHEQKGEHSATRDYHCRYFIQLLDAAQIDLWERDPLHGLARLDTEYQNIISAFDHAASLDRKADMWWLLGNMQMYWTSRGRFSEFYRWKELMNIKPDTEFPGAPVTLAHFAEGLFTCGAITFLSGRYHEAQQFCLRCLALYKQIHDDKKLARVHLYLGAGGISLRDNTALEHLHESLRLGKETKDDFSLITSTAFLGEIYTDVCDFPRSVEYLEISESYGRKSPLQALLAVTMVQWANYHIMQDQYDEAIAVGMESIALFDKSQHKSIRGWGYGALAHAYLRKGDLAKAKATFLQCLASGREAGDKSMLVYAILGFSGIALQIKNFKLSALLLSATDQLREITGYGMWSTGRKLYNELHESLVSTLGNDQFEAIKETGSQLPFENIITMAQELDIQSSTTTDHV